MIIAMHSRIEGGSSWRVRGIAAGAALTLVLAACGSGDGGDDDAADADAAEAEVDAADAADGGDGGDGEEAYEPFTITWPAGIGPDTFLTGGSAGFEEAVQETSGGLIDVEVHYGAALGPLTDHGDMLRDGLADMTWILPAYEPDPYPVNAWIDAAAFLNDPFPLIGDVQAYAASLEWGFSDASIQEFEQQGLVPLLPSINGLATYTLLCKEPAGSLDDLQGRQVRVAGGVHAAEAEALGMEPSFLPTPEVYEALERGLVDCVIQHARDIVAHGFLGAAQEVIIDDAGGGFSGFMGTGVYAHQEWWDSLPLAAKQDIWDALIGFVNGQMSLNLQQDIEFFEEANEVGNISPFPDDMRAALDAHQKQVLAEMRVSPPPGISESEADELVDELITLHDAWGAIGRELGYGDVPDDWGSFAEQAAGEIDLDAWLDEVETRILEPRRPS